MKQRRWKFAPFFIDHFVNVYCPGCLEQLDNGPPVTTISEPQSGAVIDGVVPNLVTASDDKSVTAAPLYRWASKFASLMTM